MARLSTTPVWALTIASLTGCDSGSSADAGAGGSPGSSADATATVGSSGVTTGAVVSVGSTVATGATGAGGGVGLSCDPPAAAGSLSERTAETMGFEQVSMCGYRGDVLLIVNVAAV